MCILDSLRTMWHAEHSVSTSFATKRNFLVGKVTYHGLKSAGSFIIDKIVTARRNFCISYTAISSCLNYYI